MTFTAASLVEEYGSEIHCSVGEYLLSDLSYSTKIAVIKALMNDNYKDKFVLSLRMELRVGEFNLVTYRRKNSPIVGKTLCLI